MLLIKNNTVPFNDLKLIDKHNYLPVKQEIF